MSDLEKATGALEGRDALMTNELIVYLLDSSGSMNYEMNSASVGGERRIDVAKKALKAFIAQRVEFLERSSQLELDEVTIVRFPSEYNARGDGKAQVVMQQHQIKEFSQRIDAINPTGNTPLTEAIMATGSVVQTSRSGLIRLVIISDGEPNDKSAALTAARTLVENFGVVIDTIGIGDPNDTYSGLDEAFMKQLAEIGEGEYSLVSSSDQFMSKLLTQEAERRALLGGGILLLGDGNT